MLTRTIYIYLFAWLVLSGLLFIVQMLPLGENAASYYSNLIQILSTGVNAALCFRTMSIFERKDPMRWVWGLMGAGILSWGIGQTLYTGYIVLNNGAETPYPWFSDIGFLLIQPFIVAALFTFIRAMGVRPPVWGMVFSTVLLVVLLVLSFESTYDNMVQAGSQLEYLTYVAYAVFDPVLLAITVLSASVLTGGILARPWWLCFGGLMLYFLSNRVYDFQSAQDIYVSGSWVDLGWTLAFALMGMAAMMSYNLLHPEE